MFHTKDIDNALAVGYNPDSVNKMAAILMGIDPGFGSSPFGIAVTQLSDNKVQVLFADEFEKPSHEDMLSKVLQLRAKYNPTRIYVDGANPAFIRSLKISIGERVDYDKVIEQSNHDKIDPEYLMKVIPVSFVGRTSGSKARYIDFWLRKNGQDVKNSAVRCVIQNYKEKDVIVKVRL